MTGLGVLEYRRLRAPREHGGVLIEPNLSACSTKLGENTSLSSGSDWQGLSFDELREVARAELTEQLQRYASRTGVPFDWDATRPIVGAGHQPDLFHPGVWFKNFVLDRLARRNQANAVNVLIDNDLCSEPSLRLPQLSPTTRLQTVQIDRGVGRPLPFECRPIVDRELFATFGERLSQACREWTDRPLGAVMWPAAVAASRSENYGFSLAAARHGLERQLGLKTYEVPLSQLCQGEAFARFACHLLAHAPRLWQIHNDALRAFRHVNRVRSQSHPVPDLSEDDRWLEMPFWIWQDSDPVRRPVFVKTIDGGLQITDRAGLTLHLNLSADADADRALEQLAAARNSGIQLRPRAILTTMFLRLFVSDLFIHGIGGAKYDELTDEIIRQFCELAAPNFVVATATSCLPLSLPDVSIESKRHLDKQLRQLTFQPERFVDSSLTEVQGWLQQKQEWIGQVLPRGQRRERHRKIIQANEQLQPFVAATKSQLRQQRLEVEQMLRERGILASREFSFAAFSFESLPGLLLELLEEAT